MNPRAAARRIVRATVAVATAVDARGLLSAAQRRVWDCTARIVTLLCGRRAGKTFFACVWLLSGALERAGTMSVYLALTQGSARKIVWEAMREVGAMLGVADSCFKEHTLTIRLPNGSVIYIAGTDDARTIETWRGTKIWRAVIDEMGSQIPQLIAYFVREIIWPALTDLLGRLLLMGTPGLVATGYWWDRTKPDALAADPAAFHWTIRENPAIPHAEEVIAETLTLFRWTEEHPGFQREWLAQWVVDRGALVYPVNDGTYLDSLPRVSETGTPVPPRSWRFVVGHDVGVVDPCAWAAWAWNRAVRGSYLVYAHEGQYDPDPAAIFTRRLLDAITPLTDSPNGVELVLDTGGLGKAHDRIYRTKYALPIVPAEKQGKASAITELRGDLIAGTARMLRGVNPLELPLPPAVADEPSGLDQVRAQWAVLGWHPAKVDHAPDQADHVSDAALYAYRRLRHWSVRPDEYQRPPVAPDERAVYDEQQRMKAIAQRHLQQQRRNARGGVAGKLSR